MIRKCIHIFIAAALLSMQCAVPAFAVPDGAGRDIFVGNVGIGSLAPSSTLDVNGDVRVGLGTFNNPSANSDLFVSGNLEVDGSVWLGDAAADSLTILGSLNQTGDFTVSGNLGVGTTTPQTKLAILGPVGIGTWTTPSAGTGLTVMNGNVGIGTTVTNTTLQVTSKAAGFENLVHLQNTASNWYLAIGNGDQFAGGYFNITQGVPSAANYELQFQGGGVVRARSGVSSPSFNSAITGRGDSSILGWTNTGGNFNGTLTVGQDYVSGVSNTELMVGMGSGSYVRVRNNSGNEYLRVTDTGNVGIGTTTPQGGLVVMNGNVGIGTWAPTKLFVAHGSIVDFSIDTTGGANIPFLAGPVNINNQSLSNADSIQFVESATSGIGRTGRTSDAVTKILPFSGQAAFATAATNITGGNISVTGGAGASASAGEANGGNVVLDGGQGYGTGASGNILLGSTRGKVGIGSSSPSSVLDVNGDVRIGLGTFNNPSSDNDLYVSGNLEVDGSVWLGDAAADSLTILGTLNQTGDFTVSGNLGVGTTTPQTKLAILGPVGIGTWTRPSAGTGMTVMNGNVGIGLTAPTYQLDVVGNIHATTGSYFDSYINMGSLVATDPGAAYYGYTNRIGQTTGFGGNVGIGTVPPAHMLEVGTGGSTGAITNTIKILAKDASDARVGAAIGTGQAIVMRSQAAYGSLYGYDFNAAAQLPIALQEFGGNVGIGTVTPQGALVVTNGNVGIGTWTTTARLDFGSTLSNTKIALWSDTAAGYGLGIQSNQFRLHVDSSSSRFSFLDAPAGTEIVTIKGTGNVGIGTVTPLQKLHVSGGEVTAQSINAYGSYVAFDTNGGLGMAGNAGSAYASIKAYSDASGTEKFLTLQQTGGLVGVGTISPGSALSVLGGISVGAYAPNAAPAGGVIASGNVGIGSIAPSGKLDVNGDVRIGLGTFNNPSTDTDLYVSGNLEVDGSVWLGDAAADSLTILGSLNQTGDFTVSGNLGVGTTTPQTKLAILGPVGIGTWTTPGAGTGLTVMNGNVGIGTITPGSNLSVLGGGSFGAYAVNDASAGNVIASGNIGIGTLLPTTRLMIRESSYPYGTAVKDTLLFSPKMFGGVSTNPTSFGGILWADPNGSSAVARLNVAADNLAASSDTHFEFWTFGNNTFRETLRINKDGNLGVGTTTPQGALVVTNGNVGIGTWAPAAALDVNGTSKMTGLQLTTNPSAGYILTSTSTGVGTWMPNQASGTSSQWTTTNTNDVYLPSNGNVGLGTTLTSTSALTVMNGNVGIGTWKPAAALHVVDSSNDMQVIYGGGTRDINGQVKTTAGQSVLWRTQNIAGTNRFSYGDDAVYVKSGNVGIGTTIPGGKLEVAGLTRIGTAFSSGSSSNGLMIGSDVAAAGSGVEFIAAGSGSGYGARIRTADLGTGETPLYFEVRRNSGTFTNAFTILNQGNIGVGTTTPQGAFTVTNGNVGIGTWAPSSELQVYGAVSLPKDGASINFANTGLNGSINSSGGLFSLTSSAGTAGNDNFALTAVTGRYISMRADTTRFTNAGNTVEFARINATGLGIGSTAPSSTLDVNGDVRIGLGTFNNPSTNTDLFVSGNLEVDGSVWLGDAAADSLTILGSLNQTGDFTVSGNLGVGTTTPQTKLAILGPVGIGTWTTPVAGTALAVMGGNVGIGTFNPVAKLNVIGDIQSGDQAIAGNLLLGTGASPINFKIAGSLATTFDYAGNTVGPGLTLDIGNTRNSVRIGASNDITDSTLSVKDVGTGTKQTRLAVIAGANQGTRPLTEWRNNTGTAQSVVDASGNVGIGTDMTSAAAKLAVIGGNVGVGTITPQGAFVVTNGNVGIGTWTAAAALDVNGTSKMTGLQLTTNPAAGYILTSTSTGVGTWMPNQASAGSSQWTTTNTNDVYLPSNGNVGLGTTLTSTSALTVMNGNVGIGTWVPQYTLSVVGSSITGGMGVGMTNTLIGNGNAGVNFTMTGDYTQFINNNGAFYITNADASSPIIFRTNNSTERMRIINTGNIGIGTTTPAGALTVMNGNVGIGTWVPGSALQVQGTGNITGNVSLGGALAITQDINNGGGAIGFRLINSSAQLGSGGGLFFSNTAFYTGGMDAGLSRLSAGVLGVGTGAAGSFAGSLAATNIGIGTFDVSGGGLIVKTGNVGIGSTAPSATLDVNGDVRIGLGTFNNPSTNADLFVSGNLEVDGSVWLGDAAADSLTILGSLNQTGDFTVSGNLGVGTTTPQTKFAVLGPVGIGTWTTPAAGTGMTVMNGNVGVGLTAALKPLHVYGAQAELMIERSANAGNVALIEYKPNGAYSSSNAQWETGMTSNNNSYSTRIWDGAANKSYLVMTNAGNVGLGGDITDTSTLAGANMVIKGGNVGVGTITPQGAFVVTNGNVGIGTWAPTVALQVDGIVKVNNTIIDKTYPSNLLNLGTNTVGQVQLSSANGQMILDVANNSDGFIFRTGNTPTTKVAINNAGNVGVGTITPQGAFVVTNGNVGVGTWAPSAQMELKGGNLYMNGVPASGTGWIIVNDNVGLEDANTNKQAVALDSVNGIRMYTGTGSKVERVRIDTSGNVGIGTVTPQGAFVVTNGNVGLGTWVPLQPLHVNGHCVTGDTRLRRRRRRADGTYEDDEVRIDAVQPGDEILSLDEETGELVYQQVEALMDMGVKGIYKLTTASGKTIRTTGNHPYLVRVEMPGWKMSSQGKVSECAVSSQWKMPECTMTSKREMPQGAVPQGQQKQNPTRGAQGSEWNNRLNKVVNLSEGPSASYYARLCARRSQSWQASPINRLIQSLFTSFFKTTDEYNTYHQKDNSRNNQSDAPHPWQGLEKIAGQTDGGDGFAQLLSVSADERGLGESRQGTDGVGLDNRSSGEDDFDEVNIAEGLANVNGEYGLWIRAEEIATGDYIAVMGAGGRGGQASIGDAGVRDAGVDGRGADGWGGHAGIRDAGATGGAAVFERVVRVELLPAEQVWDIQIANTRNFVAGHYMNMSTGEALSEAQEEAYAAWKDNKKGQGEFHPARSSSSLMDAQLSSCNEVAFKNISRVHSDVNDQASDDQTTEMRPASVPEPHFLQTPRAGFEPATATSLQKSSIQLSYRGGLIFDSETTIFDNISIIRRDVNQFIEAHGFDPRDVEYGGIIAHNTYINGNVGVGSSAPGTALDVQGTTRTTGLQLTTNPSAGYILTSTSTGVGTWMPNQASAGSSQWTTTNTNDVYLPSNGNVGLGTSLTSTSALTVMNGNVGIGTWVPGGALVIRNGSIAIGTTTPASNSYVDIEVPNAAANSSPLVINANNNTSLKYCRGLGAANSGCSLFQVSSFGALGLLSDNAISFSPGNVQSMVTYGGHLGVGSMGGNTMNSNLVVQGNAAVGADYITNAGPTNGMIIEGNVGIGTDMTSAAARLSVIGGNVGIGTWVPSSALNVVGGLTVSSLTSGRVPFAGTGGLLGDSSNLTFDTGSNRLISVSVLGTNNISLSDTTIMYGGGVHTLQTGAFGWTGTGTGYDTVDTALARVSAGNIGIGTSGSGTGLINGGLMVNNIGIGTTLISTSALTVMNGNVGIGTWKPAKKLEVNGGDMYINQTASKLIMKKPDGTCSSCGPDNSDIWVCASVACP